ncbi:MAG: O-antigen ligase family protein [Gammaproteobacteria bacterium]
MRWLFLALIGAFIVGDAFGMQMSLITGFSVKNAILYAIGFTLVFRVALSGGVKLDLLSLHVAFFLLIGYAALMWAVSFGVIHYPGYHMFSSLVTLKTKMVDPALMMFAAFYGLRSLGDAKWVIGALLLAIAGANFATLADTLGIVHFGMRVGDKGPEAGRIFGAFGHANDTGTLIVTMLPAMIAMMMMNHGFRRLVWLGSVLVSALVLILTVSRGAFVGLFVGTVWAAFLLRRYVRVQKFVVWGAMALVGVVLVVMIAGLVDQQIGNVISERLFGQSSSIDMSEASSGRTQIWAELLDRMARTPLTLLTGFGWDVYFVMPFRYAPHNHYLGTYFDLGIPGVALFVYLMSRIVNIARGVLPIADEETRPHILAFVFGMLSLVVAIVFADLFDPWSYIWLYVGAMMRIAVLVRESSEERVLSTRDAPLKVAQVHTPAFGEARSAFGGVLAGRPR